MVSALVDCPDGHDLDGWKLASLQNGLGHGIGVVPGVGVDGIFSGSLSPTDAASFSRTIGTSHSRD